MVGEYTDEAKAAIQAMLDVPSTSDIPTVPVQSVNGKTGAVMLDATDVGAGTYSKPSGGIPASDIADGVIPDPEDLLPEDSDADDEALTAGEEAAEN